MDVQVEVDRQRGAWGMGHGYGHGYSIVAVVLLTVGRGIASSTLQGKEGLLSYLIGRLAQCRIRSLARIARSSSLPTSNLSACFVLCSLCTPVRWPARICAWCWCWYWYWCWCWCYVWYWWVKVDHSTPFAFHVKISAGYYLRASPLTNGQTTEQAACGR
ncbi:hypothetical protein F4803DRAFT_339527 [Xylaria telfairii]|nr:hypothetical protein F4803DRAFT_339527 [Xylaria telfairii]